MAFGQARFVSAFFLFGKIDKGGQACYNKVLWKSILV